MKLLLAAVILLVPPQPTGLRLTQVALPGTDPLRYYRTQTWVPFAGATGYRANTYQWNLDNTGQALRTYVSTMFNWTPLGDPEPANTNASLHATEAWTVRVASTVDICLIDSGVTLNHPDLAGVISSNCFMALLTYGTNGLANGFSSSTNVWADTLDTDGHGTEMAGLIAAVRDNGMGISGVAPGTKLLVAKTGFDPVETTAAMKWAIAQHPRIICCCWGYNGDIDALYEQFAAARAAGILCVCAAIDEPRDYTDPEFSDYPAMWKTTLDNLLVVTCTMADDTLLPGGAGYGSPWVDLAAPCRRVPTTTKDGGYGYVSGTSGAAAQVAAGAALMMTQFPQDDYRQIIRRLDRNCDAAPAGDLAGQTLGGGRLNLGRALRDAGR